MSSADRISDSFSVNRIPSPLSDEEEEYRQTQKKKAAARMVRDGVDGYPDLVEMLGLDEVLSKEQRDGLQRLVAARGGEA